MSQFWTQPHQSLQNAVLLMEMFSIPSTFYPWSLGYQKLSIFKDNLIYMIKNLFEKPELTTVRFNISAMLEKNFITFAINALLKSMSDEQQIHNSRC